MTDPLVVYWDGAVAQTCVGNFVILAREASLLLAPGQPVALRHTGLPPDRQRQLAACFDLLGCPVAVKEEKPESFDWPTTGDMEDCSWHGSMRWVGRRAGSAQNFPEWHAGPQDPSAPRVAVHLKQHPTDTQGNADLDSWRRFFELAASGFPEDRFLLLGDEIPREWPGTPNVSHLRGDLASMLRATALARAFMGMASAFCGVAILGQRPYEVFKRPGHHEEQMKRELTEQGQFAFALPWQHFQVADDDPDRLDRAYRRLRAHL